MSATLLESKESMHTERTKVAPMTLRPCTSISMFFSFSRTAVRTGRLMSDTLSIEEFLESTPSMREKNDITGTLLGSQWHEVP